MAKKKGKRGSAAKKSKRMTVDELTKAMFRMSNNKALRSAGKESEEVLIPEEERKQESRPLSLVTGASGRLGKYLVKALLSRGQRVRVLQRHSERPPAYPEGVEVFPGDVTNRGSLEPAVEDVDTVYHLAAIVSKSAPYDVLLQVNYGGTRNLLDACRAKAFTLKRFVYVSTISVYGKSMEKLPASESTPLNPSDSYAKTKMMAEQLVSQYSDKIPSTIVRPAVIYGDGFDEAYLPMLSALEKRKMPVIGSGDNIIPFIHASDVANALILASQAEKAPGNTYVAASKETKTQREILGIACAQLGVSPPKGSTPLWMAKLKLKASAFMAALTGKKPALLEEHLDTIAANRFFDTSKAEKELGFRAKIRLEDGMKEMVEYYRLKKGGSP